MKIGDILDRAAPLPFMAIHEETSLEKAAEQLRKMPQIRGIYVVDAPKTLQGYLSLGVLIRNVIAARHKPHFHARSLLAQITTEKVADIMERNLVYARDRDDVQTMLDQMVRRNIKEIPVVDENRRIKTVIGVIDLWRLLEESDEGPGEDKRVRR